MVLKGVTEKGQAKNPTKALLGWLDTKKNIRKGEKAAELHRHLSREGGSHPVLGSPRPKPSNRLKGITLARSLQGAANSTPSSAGRQG